MVPGQVLPWAQMTLAVGAVLGGVKTVYNGYIHDRVIEPLDRIEHMDEQQDELVDGQKRTEDAVIALGRSHDSEEAEFDVTAFQEEMREDNRGPDDFLRGGDGLRRQDDD